MCGDFGQQIVIIVGDNGVGIGGIIVQMNVGVCCCVIGLNVVIVRDKVVCWVFGCNVVLKCVIVQNYVVLVGVIGCFGQCFVFGDQNL